MLKLLTMVAVLAHVQACVFWFVGDVQGQAGWMHVLGIAEAVAHVSSATYGHKYAFVAPRSSGLLL
jgi:hypothetical protein